MRVKFLKISRAKVYLDVSLEKGVHVLKWIFSVTHSNLYFYSHNIYLCTAMQDGNRIFFCENRIFPCGNRIFSVKIAFFP